MHRYQEQRTSHRHVVVAASPYSWNCCTFLNGMANHGLDDLTLNAPKRIRVASDGVGVVVALSFLQGFGSRWLVRVVSVHADAVGQDPGAWRLGSWRTAVR
jgi:hypothetical protein